MTTVSDQQDETPPDGQQENYEARFKGLQREYQKLQSTLSAKEQAVQKAEENLSTFKTSNQDALVQAQSELARVQNDLKNKENALTLIQTQHQTVQQQLTALQSEKQVRGKLADLKATDLIPFVEDGFLTFDSLEDDKVKARIEGFRERLKTLGVVPQTKLDPSGAAVPLITTHIDNDTPDLDKLFGWLMDPANTDSPDYANNSTLYYSSIK